jgi:osmotically-inducible protein OsmY
MRPVRLEEPDSDHTWLWLAGGAALGLVAGLLIADRMKGRTRGIRGLVGRGRDLASTAMRTVGPLLETARSIKAAWDDPTEEEDEPTEAPEAELLEADEDDAEDGLDARVLEAFENDPILAGRAVEIDEPRPGVIVLRGRVRSAREIRLAVTLAHGVPGVSRVRERLTVRERPR